MWEKIFHNVKLVIAIIVNEVLTHEPVSCFRAGRVMDEITYIIILLSYVYIFTGILQIMFYTHRIWLVMTTEVSFSNVFSWNIEPLLCSWNGKCVFLIFSLSLSVRLSTNTFSFEGIEASSCFCFVSLYLFFW